MPASTRNRADAGSPACSPQIPILICGLTERGVGTGHLDQAADAVLVEPIERIEGEHACCEVRREQPNFDVVAAERERQLGEVVGAEREEVGVRAEVGCHQRGTRGLDHRTDTDGIEVGDPGLVERFQHPAPRHCEFLGAHHQRDHDLDLGIASRSQCLADRLGERPDLHLVHPGLHHAEADTAGADHRVGLAEPSNSCEFGARLVVEGAGRLRDHQSVRSRGGTRATAGRAVAPSRAGRPSLR